MREIVDWRAATVFAHISHRGKIIENLKMSSRHLLVSSGNNTLNSEQIRAEIHRFESVHPSIYQIYDLLNLLPEGYDVLGTQLREQVVAIEDSFVNSHEWTLSRSISEMRLGIVGTTQSGKTSLVHRYLTGTYTAEESPEGGRFKKEVVIEGQSHLLLIRDEGQQHLDVQFCQWVDAVVFVFSVCCEQSFESIRLLAHEMSKYRNISDIPLLLIGTKDNLSEKKGRIISEEEGRHMASQMKRCAYYETSSTYGTNVERVFKDACCKIIQHRIRNTFGVSGPQTRTPTPTHSDLRQKDYQDPRYMSTAVFAAPSSARQSQSQSNYISTNSSRRSGLIRGSMSENVRPSGSNQYPPQQSQQQQYSAYRTSSSAAISPSASQKSIHSTMNGVRSSAALLDSNDYFNEQQGSPATPLATSSQVSASTSHLPTPSSTPNTQRKNRRISNIFQRPKDSHEEKNKAIEALNLGVGRAIPVKQGLLYKKSTKSALNREWKKKYVCLYNDGRLTYHQNLKDYMDKTVHGKEVFLGLATVKISGRQRPRNTQRSSAIVTNSDGTPKAIGMFDANSGGSDDAGPSNRIGHFTPPAQPMTVIGKSKKNRGENRKNADEDEECFEIVTHNQQRWEFCASSMEERDEWVAAIEEQIEIALTSQMSQPTTRNIANKVQVQALRQIDGNDKCADCSQNNPDWASLNLGILICIECSGIHRNLGSHVSKVRSLELDGWPIEHLAVMQSIGNRKANQMIWEKNIIISGGENRKPIGESSREEKEKWIEAKYLKKRFIEIIPQNLMKESELIGAVLDRDVVKICVMMANGLGVEQINAPISTKDHRTVLHLACSIGSLEIVQILIWNNADLKILDEQDRSCLWYAQNSGFQECIELLQTAGLSPNYGCPKMMKNGSIGGGSIDNSSANESFSNRDYSCIGDDLYSSSNSILSRRPAPPPPPQIFKNFVSINGDCGFYMYYKKLAPKLYKMADVLECSDVVRQNLKEKIADLFVTNSENNTEPSFGSGIRVVEEVEVRYF
ncbi:unnamed protein product [Caenorhabditis angaria]|uniref:Uncharacterized protein n=1 Tax=Caenorhabditis angaria TaxID=860376 RepID=A0A9P1MZ20_9PELO|nr:unnamed protein product [Caenorhabditis angaria]